MECGSEGRLGKN
uniref:Uncharacterized protein n=1 Tax=Anguilla anguilla TaxID=7936 RepID=A0A0E9VBL9_ANGAN